ncbi:MAG: hypothetical protein IJO89_01965 [Clostridia bacterium]|nr:hypothetical protein [Clostridia bacterium]
MAFCWFCGIISVRLSPFMAEGYPIFIVGIIKDKKDWAAVFVHQRLFF